MPIVKVTYNGRPLKVRFSEGQLRILEFVSRLGGSGDFSNKTIATWTLMTTDGVMKATKRLHSVGALVKTHRHGPGGRCLPSHYELTDVGWEALKYWRIHGRPRREVDGDERG